jgi:hypothetical protein
VLTDSTPATLLGHQLIILLQTQTVLTPKPVYSKSDVVEGVKSFENLLSVLPVVPPTALGPFLPLLRASSCLYILLLAFRPASLARFVKTIWPRAVLIKL